MTQPDRRPKSFPPPEFPPRRPALFAKVPPAVFPPILGLLGLAFALRLALEWIGQPRDAADLVAGVAVALWAFAVLAYLAKIARRPGVVVDDLRVLPGRSGLAASSMGGMAASALVAPHQPELAMGLLVAALLAHLLLAVLLARLLLSLPPASRAVNPTMHLSFVGFIVGAPAAMALGWVPLAQTLFWATLPVAIGIWGASAMQVLRVMPPAVLRPLLAIHVAPAGLLATVATLLDKDEIAQILLMFGTLCTLILAVYIRWICEAGITPLWSAFTFPLAAITTAMLVNANGWQLPGLGLAAVALIANPLILLWVLKRWPGGRLATVTNAAEA